MTSAVQQETALSITVKNTFLDIPHPEHPGAASVRRSSSVPRTFKPGDYSFFKPVESPTAPSDDSTSASDKDRWSDIQDNRSDCTCDDFNEGFPCMDGGSGWICSDPPSFDSPDESAKSRVTLSLVDLTEGQQKARTKLRTKSRPFQSTRTPPAEVMMLIANAVEVLSSGPDIIDVQVQHGGMGLTTMIVGKTCNPNVDAQCIFSLMKDALLTSAEQSENTYIMGYGARPFNNLDAFSFSANIGCVPAAHQNTACWDTYEKGFCPRCTTCRWDHPSEADTMRVIVMIKGA